MRNPICTTDFVYSPKFKTSTVRIECASPHGIEMTVGGRLLTADAFHRFDEYPARIGSTEHGAWACLAAGDGQLLGKVPIDPRHLDIAVVYEGYVYSLSLPRADIPLLTPNVSAFAQRAADLAPTIHIRKERQ